MIDTVDSASDPAGKQYSAFVAGPVNAGNGVTITQGSAATVTLTKAGSRYTAQLSSVAINGRVVAVTSTSATASASAQNTQAKAASAANSVLGGFGHHVNAPASAPASVAAVATGQHVSLPAGTTLTFVLGVSPASNTVAAATPAGNPAQPPSQSAASAGGPLTAMEICFSHPAASPSDPNYKKEYLTAAFEVPIDALRPAPVLEPAFSAYLKSTYNYSSAGITCQPIWTIREAKTVQEKISNDPDVAKLKMIDTGWRYGQPPLAQGQSGFDPLAQGTGGLDLAQHRLTTYYCTLLAAGGTSWGQSPDPQAPTRYVSPVFQAGWDSAAISNAWYAYIRDHYVHDLDKAINGGHFGPGDRLCSAQSPAIQAMLHPGELRVDTVARHVVAVDWTDTPAQAAAANVAAPPAAATPTATTAAQSSSGKTAGPFISCSTSGGPGFDIYITGIFQTTKPVKHAPNGWTYVDQSVLDDFYAYLTQKGYKFKPGSNSSCDVSPTEDAAKAAQHTRIYGSAASCGFCGKKFVETGWKE
jgi:hypothetical protein